MRVLFLSFVLALPLASVASASDGDETDTSSSAHGNLGRRTIGLGIGQDMGYVGLTNGASLVDETSLRWQPSGRIALEPNLRFGLRGVDTLQPDGQPSDQTNQAAQLGTRLRVTAVSRGPMHLVGLVGVDGGVSNTTLEDEWDTTDQRLTSVYANVSTGFGIEYAPKRWWGLGVDYRLNLAGFARTEFGWVDEPQSTTDWRIGPTDAGRIIATGHVYF